MRASETTIPGPEIRINCPTCGGVAVQAETRAKREWLFAFLLIPVFRKSTTIVTCGECGEEHYSRYGLKRLAQRASTDAPLRLLSRKRWEQNFLAVLAALTVLIPVAGIVLGLVAVFETRRRRDWALIVSCVALLLSVVVNAAFLPDLLAGHERNSVRW